MRSLIPQALPAPHHKLGVVVRHQSLQPVGHHRVELIQDLCTGQQPLDVLVLDGLCHRVAHDTDEQVHKHHAHPKLVDDRQAHRRCRV